jgi:hypothetical protein
MKLSNKDLLILLGIAVAVIITLTTLVFTDQAAVKKAELPATEKTAVSQMAKQLIGRAIRRTGL